MNSSSVSSILVRPAADVPHGDGGNLFSSARWLDVLRDEYSFDFEAIVEDAGTSPRPLLYFAKVTDIFGERVLSLPFSDYTEPHVKDDRELRDALDLLKRTYRGCPITIRLHGESREAEAIGFANIRRALCHRISLRGSLDEVLGRTEYAFRKGVNKAKRNGLRIEIDNTAHGIDVFHALLSKLRRRKYRILAQPQSFYRSMLRHFVEAGQGNIWVAYCGDRPAAAAILLHSGPAVFDKMGVSDDELLEYRANNLLLWAAIEHAHANGFEYLDMGLSQTDYTGLIRFKESAGGVGSPINYYRYAPPGFDTARERDTKKLLSGLTAFLVNSDLHDAALEPAAALLYKYFA